MNKKNRTVPSGKPSLHILGRLLGYMLRFWPLTLAGIGLSLASNYLALLGPQYLGEAIDAISSKSGVMMDVVWDNFRKMLVCYLLSAILAYLMTVAMVNLSQRITYRMRKHITAHFLRLI